MNMTKGAIGNLINKYKTVLKKCRIMNVFGSLAVAGMLVMGGAGIALAETPYDELTEEELQQGLDNKDDYHDDPNIGDEPYNPDAGSPNAEWGKDNDVTITGHESVLDAKQAKNLTVAEEATLVIDSANAKVGVTEISNFASNSSFKVTNGAQLLSGTINVDKDAHAFIGGKGSNVVANELYFAEGSNLTISNGAVLSLAGPGLAKLGGTINLEGTSAESAGIINIPSDAGQESGNVCGILKVGAGNYGAIVSNKTDLTGTLEVSGSLGFASSSQPDVQPDDSHGGHPPYAQFNVVTDHEGIKSGIFKVTETGIADLATKNVDLNVIGGKVENAGTINAKVVKISGGKVVSNVFVQEDTEGEPIGVYTKALTLAGGTIEGDITAKGKTIAITGSGNTIKGTLDLSAQGTLSFGTESENDLTVDGDLKMGGYFTTQGGKNSITITGTGYSDNALTFNDSVFVTMGAGEFNSGASDKSLTITSGEHTFVGLGADKSFFNGTSIHITGGELQLGTDGHDGTPGNGKGGISRTADVNITGGEFDVNNGKWEVVRVNQNGGGVNVHGGTLKAKTFTQAEGVLELNGGTLIANDYSLGDGEVTGNADDVYISGDALGAGSNAPGVYAKDLTILAATDESFGLIEGNLSVTNGGSLTFNEGSDLDVKGNLSVTGGSLTVGNNSALSVAGDLTLSGVESVDVTAITNAELLVEGTFTVDTTYDSLDVGTGNTAIGALVANKDGTANPDAALSISGGTHAFLGLGADKAFFNGSAIGIKNGAILRLGSKSTEFSTLGGKIEGTTITVASGSTLHVDKGTWKVVSIGTNGGITVESGGTLDVKSGTLDVSGSSLGVASDATTFSTGASSRLIVDASDYEVTPGADGKITAFNFNEDCINKQLSNAGVLDITGFAEGTTISLANYKKLAGKADKDFTKIASGGVVNLKGVEVSDVSEKTTLDEVKGIGVETSTVKVDKDTAANESYDVGGLKEVKDDFENKGTLTVTGKTKDGSVGTLADNNLKNTGTMNLGSEGQAANFGKDLTTGDGGTTNVAGDVDVAKMSTEAGANNTATNDAGSGKATEISTTTTDTGNATTNVSGKREVETFAVRSNGAGDAKANVTGSVTTKTLTAEKGTGDAIINVGDSDKAGKLIVADTASLDGATLFLDPAWKDGVGIEGASSGAIAKFTNDEVDGNLKVDGNLIVGQNSFLSLGVADTAAAQKAFKDSKLTWGKDKIAAALYIAKPHSIDSATGAIVVDGSLPSASSVAPALGSATFAGNSLLMVDAKGIATGTALTATGITVKKGASLLIANAGAGDIVIAKDTNNVAITGGTEFWGYNTSKDTDSDGVIVEKDVDKATLKFTNELDYAKEISNTAADGFVVTVAKHSSKEKFPHISGGNQAILDAYTPGAGNPMLDIMLDSTNSASIADKEVAIESSAQTGALSGVATAAMGVSTASAGAVTARNSASGIGSNAQTIAGLSMDQNGNVEGLSAGSDIKNGVGLWLMPLYKWTNVQGLDAGSGLDAGYDSGLGGIALGADYTFNDTFRLGLAFNVGAGYADSNGDVSKTSTDFDFWGLGLYGTFMKENFSLTADVGYSGVYAKADQDFAGVANTESKMDTDVWTVGLTAEYVWKTDAVDIMPHVGVRYMSTNTYGYDVEMNGTTVREMGSDTQDVWYFPLGVTFSKDFEANNGWYIKPKLDLGVIIAAGDLKANSDGREPITGLNTAYEMQNVDDFAFNGGLGFDFGNENITFGINYNLLASEHETGHMVFGTFRYDF